MNRIRQIAGVIMMSSLAFVGGTSIGTAQAADEAGIYDMTRVQSVDPTLANYVPEESLLVDESSVVQPLSAYGIGFYGGFSINIEGIPVRIPKGEIRHSIDGDKTLIRSEKAMLSGTIPGQVCNMRVDFQNRYGTTIYNTWSTNTIWSCIGLSGKTVYAPLRNAQVRPGLQCARLYLSGTFVGEQCHKILN